MPGPALSHAFAPLLSVFFFSISNGFLASLITLRLDSAGVPASTIGFVSSSYFIGVTFGALFNDRLIARIGHIRAYSSFASLAAAAVLMQGLFFDPWSWFALRLIGGWASVGVYLVIESWLLLAADPKARGRLLAQYMIALYGAIVVGQVALGPVNDWGRQSPFLLAGILLSLSVLPIVTIPQTSPHVDPIEPVAPIKLLSMTPTGVIGCLGSGIAIGAVYTLLPLYLQRTGLGVGEVGESMAVTILGAMMLQYPVGRWSDRKDRQVVLIGLSAFCLSLSILIGSLPHSKPVLLVLLFFLGGGIFAIYPVAVSHATDSASPNTLVRMIQGLLLANALGSSISPLAISPLMTSWGTAGLFWAFSILNAVMIGLFLWRRKVHRPPEPVAPFAAAVASSPLGAELRVTDDVLQSVNNPDGASEPEAAFDEAPASSA